MIQYVNATKNFIEKISSPLMIYTAGHAAYWVGDFLKRCNIDFLGYIDNSVPGDGGGVLLLRQTDLPAGKTQRIFRANSPLDNSRKTFRRDDEKS